MSLSGFGAAFAVYLIGTASPGPANLAIAHASLNHGRAPGLSLAAGVICGSMCWGAMAAAGVSALLMSAPAWLAWLKLAGAAYLLWLAYRTVRAAWSARDPLRAPGGSRSGSRARFYLQGLGIHLTNPKAVLSWLTVTTLGLGAATPPWVAFALVAGCCALGFCVFVAYALVFSSQAAGPVFARIRKPFGVACGAFYCALAAGFVLSLT
ncbi:LysE family translocator [Burkholderia alba]|uniref:LysE family translocator n=1 Tax=Burkholderia alba TaxID=2683677 RepID=UPI002B05FF27|nr:LysE family translocator [Burkholderia alba]